MMRRAIRRFRRDDSGATALEFALLALPLMLMTFGIIEFGRALFLQQTLTYATDKAARTLYLAPTTPLSTLEAMILDDLFLADPARLEVTLCYSTTASCGVPAGSIVTGSKAAKLSVTYDFHSVVPELLAALVTMEFQRIVILPK
jgi:Flp pilus assembly pilin Flp